MQVIKFDRNDEGLIEFIEFIISLINILDKDKNAVYNLELFRKRNKEDTTVTFLVRDSYDSLSNTKISIERSIVLPHDYARLLVNTVRNYFIETREVHRPFIDRRTNQQVIENSKFHLCVNFNPEAEEDVVDTDYFQDLAVNKYSKTLK